MTARLVLRDVHCVLGGTPILRGVSLDLDAGAVTGVIGPNGAGKTTALNVISGYVAATAGSVTLSGADLLRMNPWDRARAGLGRTFQTPRLVPDLTVRDNLRAASPPGAAGRRAVAEALDLTGTADLRDLPADRLTVTGRRFVELARAVAAGPAVILLDEPATGLRGSDVGRLVDVLAALRDRGIGSVVVSHDLPLVRRVCGRLVALDAGRVIVDGTPADVLRHPDVVTSYLGSSTGADAA
jgi:ABC-type branched-subunit amino acid transport system ATPase component